MKSKLNWLTSISLLLCMLVFTHAKAQESTLSGTITSSNGETIPGAYVRVDGTSTGTITDANGRYALKVKTTDALIVVSSVGYVSQKIQIGSQSTIDVVMAEDVTGLDEVVVVGYGTQKKSLVTGSIAKVDGSELIKTSSLRVSQALQGKTAGVVITNNSGQPGESVSVRVRGTGTNGDAEPLYIVDGMPLNGSGIDYLNSSDIESIEVLKDASSAAIYGSRGGNGVVLITTKKGKKDQKFTVSYDMYYSIQNPWRKIDVLNAQEYMDIINESDTIGTKSKVITFPQDRRDTISWNTNWQDEMIYENAPKQNHVVSFMAGDDKSTYASSLSYFNQDGIVAKGKSNFERIGYRLNTSREFGALTLGSNINLTQIKSKGVSANSNSDGSALVQALNMPPIVPVKYDNGEWATPEDFGLGLQEISNPIAMLSYRNSLTTTRKMNGNIYGDYNFGKLFDVLQGLKFRTSYNQEYTIVNYRDYTPVYSLDATHISTVDKVNENDNHYIKWNIDNTLTYQKAFGEHNITLLAGHAANQEVHESLSATKNNLIFDDFEHAYLDNATDATSVLTDGTYDKHTILSYFGRADYDYAGKYMLTGILRRDGSSNFGSNNKFGYFPSVSLGWNISKEDFFPKSDVFNYMKIRGGWGQNGNESIGSFKYISVMSNDYIYYFGTDQTQVNGTKPSRYSNPNLRWETSEQTNLATDLGFFSNQLTLTIDLYIKKTKDLLITAPAMRMTGNAEPTSNGGSIQNKGIEFELGYKKKIGDLNIDAKVTGSYNINEVLDINNSEKILSDGSGGFGQSGILRASVGEPIGYFYGYKTEGVFQNADQAKNYVLIDSVGVSHPYGNSAEAGDLIYVDSNHDGVISDKDRVKLGNPNPDFTGGFNLSLDWKGLDFNMFWYAALGQQTWMALRRNDQTGANYIKEIADNRWHGEGTSNHYPKIAKVDDAKFSNWKTPNDIFVYNSSYLRLRNITLGYTLPNSFTNKIRIAKFRVYVQADNLVTITEYPGYDPEIGGGPMGLGIDRGVYPQATTYTAGLNVTF